MRQHHLEGSRLQPAELLCQLLRLLCPQLRGFQSAQGLIIIRRGAYEKVPEMRQDIPKDEHPPHKQPPFRDIVQMPLY